MQVGDSFVGIDHGEGGALGYDLGKVRLDGRFLIGRKIFEGGVKGAKSIIGIKPGSF